MPEGWFAPKKEQQSICRWCRWRQNIQWEKRLSVFARTGPFKRRVGRNRKGNKKLLFFQWYQIDPAEIDFCSFRLENNFPFSER